MNEQLHLLLLEDSRLDADLALTTLTEAGCSCTAQRVETEDDFKAALVQGGWDLILADYSLPAFDGVTALEIAQRQCPDIPFIFLSGALGEELAIETLKRGATDYVLKQRLQRLAPAVRRALREAEERRARQRAEQEVTDMLQREQAARAQAEAANRAKDIFLATVSHELRTPLNAILGWVKLLQAGHLSPQQFKQAIGAISRGAQAQVQLVDDLLDVSRIISGKMSLDLGPVNLAEVIEAALEVVRPAAQVKQLRLITQLEPSTEIISGDKTRLQQVFWNLFSNAVKFTPSGGCVKTELRRVNAHLEVTVHDTGKGISPDFLPYVFDPFQQADGSTTRKYGGLGLGLAITKHLVEMHAGSINVTSDGAEKGTTFTLKFPLLGACASAQSVLPARATSAPTLTHDEQEVFELQGLRVLAVEDAEDTRSLLHSILTHYGAEARVVASTAEALATLDEWLPDVLVSDIGLPDEDGYSLIAKLRQRSPERGGRVLAIALTAYAQAQDRIRALSSGFQLHVSKPIEPAELAAAIRSLTELAKRTG